MTPSAAERAVLADLLRSVRFGGEPLSEEAIARMLRAVDGRIEEALKVARRTMQNEHYNKPRIGMEAECAQVDAALALFSPAETPVGASVRRPEPYVTPSYETAPPPDCPRCRNPLGPAHACIDDRFPGAGAG